MATVLKFDGATPAPGIKVSFSIKQNQSGASLERTHSETLSDGTATAVYKAGNTPGVDIIEVKAGGAKGSITFNVAGGGQVVSTVIVAADPGDVDLGGYSSITVEGRTFDDFPAVGSQVDFSFQVNNSNGVFIHENQSRQQVTRHLDSQGRAVVTYQAGNRSGVDVILVDFPQVPDMSETISINVGQGKTLGEISLQGFKLADPNEWVIRAVVRDRDGNPASDIGVNFNAENGVLDENFVETNINGVAEVTLTTYGRATVEALVENIRQQVTVSVSDYIVPGSLELDVPNSTDEVPVSIRALVRDAQGFPLFGVPVSFYTNKGTFISGDMYSDSVTVETDANGIAQILLSAGTSGTARITANIGNISVSRTISIIFPVDPVEPDDLVITTAAAAAGTVGQSYSFRLRATGGTTPYTWFAVGLLPAGLNLDQTGLISGTPTQIGEFEFDVMVVDARDESDLRAIKMVIAD